MAGHSVRPVWSVRRRDSGAILTHLAGQPDVVSLASELTINYSAVAIWLLGIACYHLWAQTPNWGAALTTLGLTFLLALTTRPSRPRLTVVA